MNEGTGDLRQTCMYMKAKLGECACQSDRYTKLDIVEGSHESKGQMASFCNIQLLGFA